MNKNQEIPQWFLEDPGYRSHIINGKNHEYDFKNVFISESDDINSGEYLVDLRVNRATEAEDMRKAIIIKDAPKNSYKIDLINQLCTDHSEYDPAGPPEEWQAGFRSALQKVLDIIKP